MKLTYDFHIHTALSPCGENSMTPNNIVHMALLCGLDVIAITDHNTCENVGAVLEVAKDTELLVLPGIEVETREEIHVICLFSSLETVLELQNVIYQKLPPLKNKVKIFGEQLVLNAEDEEVGHLERLLTFATDFSIDDLCKWVLERGGAFIPAHIDRPSYSVLSNLGIIPDYLGIRTLEISRHAEYEIYANKYNEYQVVQSSDAHELGYIGICNRQIESKEKSVQSIIDALNKV
ncbi:MAG: PHP domain-containing protein [Vallitaleaceae bacterium]|nr:PHP domain-containing protein [Vallitaleaceae bacterium]